jgi:DASH complex subunit DAD3
MSTLDSSPGATGEESLSPLEQEVLDEYVRLAGNLGDVS